MRHLLATDCFPKITPLHWNPRLSSRKSHRCGWSWKPGRTNPGCPHQSLGSNSTLPQRLSKIPGIHCLCVLPLTSVCSPSLNPLGLMILTFNTQIAVIKKKNDNSWEFMMTLDDSWYDQWWCFQFFSGDDLPFRLRGSPLNPPALGEPKPPPLNLFRTILAFPKKETENFHFCYLVPNKRCTCAFKRTNDQNNTHSLSSLSSFGSSYERLLALCMNTCLGHTQSTNGHSQLALPRLAAQEGGSQQSWARQHCPHKGPPSAKAALAKSRQPKRSSKQKL